MKMLLLFLLLVSTSTCFAQANAKAPATVQAIVQSPQSTAASQLLVEPADTRLSEKDYYKQLAEASNKATDSAISVSEWTLGIMAGLFALIFGSQFLYNTRLNNVELEKIRAELQAQSSALEVSLTKRLSDEAERNAATAASREQAIESQLRASINRELDDFKANMQNNTSSELHDIRNKIIVLTQKINTVPDFIKAEENYRKGNNVLAFKSFFKFMEDKINDRSITNFMLNDAYVYLLILNEYDEELYGMIVKIESFLKENYPFSYNMWNSYTAAKPVYRITQDSTGKDTKEYIKNPPLKSE